MCIFEKLSTILSVSQTDSCVCLQHYDSQIIGGLMLKMHLLIMMDKVSLELSSSIKIEVEVLK